MMEYINEISNDSCNKQSCGIFDTHTHTHRLCQAGMYSTMWQNNINIISIFFQSTLKKIWLEGV